MRRPLAGLVLGLVFVGWWGIVPAAWAQEAEDKLGPPPVQYSFAPPGARSLAMGAAFIGLADDATASESNPAGLTILSKPEISAHFRYSEFENEVPNTVTGRGFETFTTRVGSPAFFSAVYPWKSAALSLYYQRAADYRLHSQFDGLQAGEIYDVDRVDLAFRIENLGLSAAYNLGDTVRLGASVRGTRVTLDSAQGINLHGDPLGIGIPPYLLRIQGLLDDSEMKVTFNAGVLVTPVSKVSLGAVYKQGQDFDFSQTFEVSVENLGGSVGDTSQQATRITVPDVFGGGVAIRPTDRFTVVVDAVRILYSQTDQVTWTGSEPRGGNLYQRFGQGTPTGGAIEVIEDGTQVHVGAEYTWSHGSDWLFALRGGYYRDPDHDGLAALDSTADQVTFGGGVVVKNALQVDAAANLGKHLKEGLISFVVRF